MTATTSLDKVHRLLRVTVPQSWYDFKPLHSQLKLVAPEKPLVAWLAITYILAATTFFGQVVYYSGLTSTHLVVSDDYDLPGYVCRPLQHDPEYGLSITYDECMANYRAPTADSLMSPFGHHGFRKPKFYDTKDGTEYEVLNGPWSMSDNQALEVGFWDSPPTYYHTPLLLRPHQAYTFTAKCNLTLFPGYFDKQNPSSASSPFSWPCDFASTLKTGNAYAAFSICNKDPGELGFTYNTFGGDYYDEEYPYYQHHTFFPETGTDFVTKCAGNLTTDQQTDLYTYGGYAFPRCHSTITDISWSDDSSQRYDLAMKPHSIGISPLYPKGTTLDVIQNGRAWASTSDSFFGYPRCEFYERQMAKETYEYIYSQENCHPCDGFKFNSPFHCEKTVKKTAAEIIALSVSNSMALMGALVAAAPLVLKMLTPEDDVGVDAKAIEESRP